MPARPKVHFSENMDFRFLCGSYPGDNTRMTSYTEDVTCKTCRKMLDKELEQ
jgi:hypothetical protein